MVGGRSESRLPGGDDLGVHAAPVQPAAIAPVLHLDAAVEHNGQAASRGELGGLKVDEPELQPQRLGLYRHGLLCDGKALLRGTEHVHEVHRLGDARQVRVGLLAKDPVRLGGHGDDAGAFLLEVARGQPARTLGIRREADDRDRPRVAQEPLDDEWVLVEPLLLGRERRVQRYSACNAWSRSHRRSSTFSSPIDRRMSSGPTPPLAKSSSVSCWCVVEAGWITRLRTSPMFARCENSCRPSMNFFPGARPLMRALPSRRERIPPSKRIARRSNGTRGFQPTHRFPHRMTMTMATM